jgi:hypothetical protein
MGVDILRLLDRTGASVPSSRHASDLVSFIDNALPCEKQDWIGRRHWRNGSQVAMLANSTKAVRVIVA